MRRVDSHHHLLYPEERVYPFLQSEPYRSLEKRYGVEELSPDAAAAGVERTIAVETVPDEEETLRLLQEANCQQVIGGVVGFVKLVAPDVSDRIARLREAPGGERLVSLRHLVHDEPNPDWLCRDDALAGLRAVQEADLAWDLLIRPRNLPAAIRLADALPELRLVVDHIAKPVIGPATSPLDAAWEEGLRELARRPQVFCKLSGMVTETYPGTGWDEERLRPYMLRALEWFSPERLMFGSDWPVCLLAAQYGEVHSVVSEFAAAELSPSERDGVLGGVATRFYRLQD